MNIVYLGSGQFGIPSLEAIVASRHKITLVITQPAQPAGRGRKITHTPAANWAFEKSIPVIETADVNAPEVIEKIKRCGPDLIVVIAFGQKIGIEVRGMPPKGIINVHASLLPKYRGAAPINRAIVNGEVETGVTIITVAEKMDAGDILAQAKTPICWDHTAEELSAHLAKLAAPLLVETVDKIEAGTAQYVKQDESQATRAPKMKKHDGFLDFNESAEIQQRKILGFWPWPGASAIFQSLKTDKQERVIFAKAEVLRMANPGDEIPGTLDENLNVICGKNRLQILKLKPENSRQMSFSDFVHGRRVSPGDKFIKIEA
jgi:methionyl-tRNA formyltransferase